MNKSKLLENAEENSVAEKEENVEEEIAERTEMHYIHKLELVFLSL